jgi:hypothetical protein
VKTALFFWPEHSRSPLRLLLLNLRPPKLSHVYITVQSSHPIDRGAQPSTHTTASNKNQYIYHVNVSNIYSQPDIYRLFFLCPAARALDELTSPCYQGFETPGQQQQPGKGGFRSYRHQSGKLAPRWLVRLYVVHAILYSLWSYSHTANINLYTSSSSRGPHYPMKRVCPGAYMCKAWFLIGVLLSLLRTSF